MPCPDRQCTTEHRRAPEPDDTGRWRCPTTRRWFHQCVSCRGHAPLPYWWSGERGTRRYVHQLGWLCITQSLSTTHPERCECGEPAHRRRSECPLARDDVTSAPEPTICRVCNSPGARQYMPNSFHSATDVAAGNVCRDGVCCVCRRSGRWTEAPAITPSLSEAEEADTSRDGYINADCPVTYTGSPERRCTTPHAEPPDNYGMGSGTWTCPGTNRTYRYCFYCADEGNENQGWHWTRSGRPSERVMGEWCACPPSDHGLYPCPECGSYNHEDDGPCCDEPFDDDYDDDYGGGRTPERRTLATCCNTYNDHFNELDEVFVCQCAAEQLRQNKVPVKAAA